MIINDLKNKYFKVLDNGFVAVKDFMGTDDDIAESARVSYQASNKKSTNKELIRYLLRHKHTSPFEMAEIKLHIGLPIFVARQWIRHRTASVNEYSGRYSVMPLVFYTPESEQYRKQSTTNKQGSSSHTLNESERTLYEVCSKLARNHAINAYNNALNVDLARELARIDLPLSIYTYWYWKIDAHNLLHFLKLRLDKHAQWEIRQYAKVIAAIVRLWLPITWEAFYDYILNGVCFSRLETRVLKKIISTDDFSLQDPYDRESLIAECKEIGLSTRETNEFIEKLKFEEEETYELDLSKTKNVEYYEKIQSEI
jgi:thymidylate synthase (FAD)